MQAGHKKDTSGGWVAAVRLPPPRAGEGWGGGNAAVNVGMTHP